MFCFLAAALPTWISNYPHWWIGGVIVLGGLLIFGRSEIARLAFRRVWAISSVCFAESIRRRVLWVTPLGIIGVIAVSLLQHPVDQQEAMRQTIKFCLFASGALVTITAMVLACTNLPREIETRIIFTIVTKPTTRLEIVVGKVLGFIRVSGVIVIIMGLFTFAFLHWQNWQLESQVSERLTTETDPGTLLTLRGYKKEGLLHTLSLEHPVDFQIYNHLPNRHGPQWLSGGQGYSFSVPFELNRQDQVLLDAASEDPPRATVLVINTLRLKRHEPTAQDLSDIATLGLSMGKKVYGPVLPGHPSRPRPTPQLLISIEGPDHAMLVPPNDINGGKLTDAIHPPGAPESAPYSIATQLSPESVRQLLGAAKFFITVTPQTPSVEYEVNSTPVVLDVIDNRSTPQHLIDHVIKGAGPPRFTSHFGRYGMQIVGSPAGEGSVADFRFDNAPIAPRQSGSVEFRFRGGIQRGGDFDPNQAWSVVALRIFNRSTRELSNAIKFHPETNRDTPILVPASDLAGGNFDAYIQGMDAGQWIGMTPDSVQLVSAEHSFSLNLLKSLAILWLFSILVVVIAVFSSTFLSWPIAIVLTLVILLGHWSVEEMGDALNPGVGRSVAQDLGFGRSAAQSNVISTSVESLAKMLKALSTILPDLSQFPVMDDITRGVSIPPEHMLDAVEVLLYYGLPMLVVSFIIFKKKEVAP